MSKNIEQQFINSTKLAKLLPIQQVMMIYFVYMDFINKQQLVIVILQNQPIFYFQTIIHLIKNLC